MSDNKMYNILGIFKGLNDNAKAAQLNESVKQETVYENVEPRGSITEAVKSLEEKYMGFKAVEKAAKAGGAEDPAAVAASIGRKKYGKKKFQKAAAAGKKLGEAAKPDFLDVDKDGDKKEPFKKAVKDKKQVEEGQGPYELYNPKHPKFKANYEKYKAKHPDCTLAEFVAAMKKREHGVNEAAYDEPAAPDASAIERRKRLQAIKDRQEELGLGKDEVNTPIRKVAGKAYGGAAQKDAEEKDELDEYSQAEYDQAIDDFKTKGGKATQLPPGSAKNPISTASRHISGRGDAGKGKLAGKAAKSQSSKAVVDVYEKAPPGAKAERMVKHIKKGYAKDGKLTNKEKAIAYATAWKAKKAGQVEEGVEFNDTVKNSTPNISKVKPAKLKESRMIQEGDYYYESIGKALAEKNPNLDTSSGEFVAAVRQEMVAQGMKPNQARNILAIDEDFLMDVASSYGHYCKELNEYTDTMTQAQIPSPDSKHPVTKELDEIAKLAGLPTTPVCEKCGCEHSELDECAPLAAVGAELASAAPAIATVSMAKDAMDESEESGASLEQVIDLLSQANNRQQAGKAEEAVSFLDQANAAQQKLSREDGYEIHSAIEDMIEQINSGSWDDYEVHNGIEDIIMTLEMDLDESVEMEGNEFSGALAAAKASGQKEFEVDGKRYTVKEDATISVSATLEDDALNLMRKLAGMAEKEVELRDVPSAEEVGLEDELDEERDVEYVNTPREKTAPVGAAYPSGNGEDRAKKMYRKEYPGDNPMAVKENVEDALWKKYSGMLKSLIQK